jgi:hypothetical protein
MCAEAEETAEPSVSNRIAQTDGSTQMDLTFGGGGGDLKTNTEAMKVALQ